MYGKKPNRFGNKTEFDLDERIGFRVGLNNIFDTLKIYFL